MNIGILTTIQAYNYGALLQAFSLQQYIANRLNRSCEIINFDPQIRRNEASIYYPNTNVRNIIRNVLLFININVKNKKKKRIEKFDSFKRDWLKIGKNKYVGGASLSGCVSTYDCIICGSDQIWNMSLFPGTYYFLDFAKESNVNRISYAPSVLQPIHEAKIQEVQSSLAGFKAISVREREDVPVIEKIANRHVHRVIDPVFLNTKEFWRSKAKKYEIGEPYILCYFLGGENSSKSTIEHIKKQTGLKVCAFNLSYKSLEIVDYDCTDADPLEFLYLIDNAALVCTNSFHCTAFSIIFQKDFYLISMNKKRNARMLNLIEDFSINNRIIEGDEIPSSVSAIDYTNIDKKIIALRQESENFLKEALSI